ncbi:MAG: insulinase family protein [Muribaculaceae bacterium]|nr:insulinase family protein [Muribaculaceae bacterium]
MKLPPVERVRLDNGVELVMLDHGRQPVNRITVSWPVGTADTDSPDALRLLRLMLCEGAGVRTGAEIAEIFEYNGAWIKVEAGRHITSITLHSLNKSAEEVVPVIADIIKAPTFPSDTFQRIREKEASASALRRRKVEQMCAELSNVQKFGSGAPLAVAQTPDTIRSVTSEMLTDVYRRLMLGVVPTVYVAGALDSGLMSLVADMAGGIAFGHVADPVARRVVPAPGHSAGERGVVRDEESLQTAIKIALPAVNREHADYELLRYTVFALGGYFRSRLMTNIREDKGFTYGINASLAGCPEGAFVGISCQSDNRFAEAVIEETEKEISRLASEPMGDEELDIVRNTALSGLTAMLDSPFSIMDYHQILDLYGLPHTHYERQLEVLLSLTPDSVMQCAAKHLSDAPRLVALAGNPA